MSATSAYLRRLGIEGTPPPTPEVLFPVHRRHPDPPPYEEPGGEWWARLRTEAGAGGLVEAGLKTYDAWRAATADAGVALDALDDLDDLDEDGLGGLHAGLWDVPEFWKARQHA